MIKPSVLVGFCLFALLLRVNAMVSFLQPAPVGAVDAGAQGVVYLFIFVVGLFILFLIGVYIVLRGMSYIGHGLSHSIFGGYAVAGLAGVNLFLGAGIWGVVTALAVVGTMSFGGNAEAARQTKSTTIAEVATSSGRRATRTVASRSIRRRTRTASRSRSI